MTALPERDETAAICRDRNSFPESDPSFPDTGRVRLPNGDDPLDEMGIPAGVQEYFDREIKHHTPDAWINTSRRHTAASSRPGRLGRSGPTPAARNATQDQLYARLAGIVDRFRDLDPDARSDFRGGLRKYNRLYSFLAQILAFTDADLEKLHVFARYLRPLLPGDGTELPREVQQNIDMESYRLQRTGSGGIGLSERAGTIDPRTSGIHQGRAQEEVEALSRIIAELNERFGIELGPEHRVTLEQMMDRLEGDRALDAVARVNTRENVRLTFDNKVEEVIQEIVDSNFNLYKRITDDEAFGELVKTLMFDQYLRTHRNAEALIKQGESKTLEFKSTLRWNLKEDRKDKRVTFAALKTIAAFLNTEGGDLLIGVADDVRSSGSRRTGWTTTTSSCFISSRSCGMRWGIVRGCVWIRRRRSWRGGRCAW